jgi:hypothetical protein
MLYLQRFGAQIKDTYYEEVPGSVQLLLNELPFHVQKPAVKRGLTRLLDGLRDTASNVLFRWIIPGSIENRKPSPTTSERSSEPDKDSSPPEPPSIRSILLCISRLRSNYHRTVMIHVNTAQVQDDEDLFKTLKRAYRHEVGEIQWWISMRTITRIRFVQVYIPQNQTRKENVANIHAV